LIAPRHSRTAKEMAG